MHPFSQNRPDPPDLSGPPDPPSLSIRCADTVWVRLKGWLGRRRLDEGEALWLSPCRAVHTLGMRMPIDVVFLDARGAVVRIVPTLAPGRAVACLRAASVLELAAGTMRQPGARRRVEFAMAALIAARRAADSPPHARTR